MDEYEDAVRRIVEDADLRSNLAALDSLRELQNVLTWPQPMRDALARSLVGRSAAEPLAQLIAIAETDKVARLRFAPGDSRPIPLDSGDGPCGSRASPVRPSRTSMAKT